MSKLSAVMRFDGSSGFVAGWLGLMVAGSEEEVCGCCCGWRSLKHVLASVSCCLWMQLSA
ncbi:MAG: hypothetical protein CMP23_08155 [Rickettsiales bacterium]|nr:hypothetical protein [Rickettsiales bacterium]